jgi:hypothetical protein
VRRCVGSFHEKSSVLRRCIDEGGWLVLDPFVGGGKQRAQVSVEELSDTSVSFPVVGAPRPGIGVANCFAALFPGLRSGIWCWAGIGSRMWCWAWLGFFGWVSSRIDNFFCWAGPDFDSGGGRAGGVEGRCVGVGRRARVGDVVGEDA